jgi:hypothetical protein
MQFTTDQYNVLTRNEVNLHFYTEGGRKLVVFCIGKTDSVLPPQILLYDGQEYCFLVIENGTFIEPFKHLTNTDKIVLQNWVTDNREVLQWWWENANDLSATDFLNKYGREKGGLIK